MDITTSRFVFVVSTTALLFAVVYPRKMCQLEWQQVHMVSVCIIGERVQEFCNNLKLISYIARVIITYYFHIIIVKFHKNEEWISVKYKSQTRSAAKSEEIPQCCI